MSAKVYNDVTCYLRDGSGNTLCRLVKYGNHLTVVHAPPNIQKAILQDLESTTAVFDKSWSPKIYVGIRSIGNSFADRGRKSRNSILGGP